MNITGDLVTLSTFGRSNFLCLLFFVCQAAVYCFELFRTSVWYVQDLTFIHTIIQVMHTRYFLCLLRLLFRLPHKLSSSWTLFWSLRLTVCPRTYIRLTVRSKAMKSGQVVLEDVLQDPIYFEKLERGTKTKCVTWLFLVASPCLLTVPIVLSWYLKPNVLENPSLVNITFGKLKPSESVPKTTAFKTYIQHVWITAVEF